MTRNLREIDGARVPGLDTTSNSILKEWTVEEVLRKGVTCVSCGILLVVCTLVLSFLLQLKVLPFFIQQATVVRGVALQQATVVHGVVVGGASNCCLWSCCRWWGRYCGVAMSMQFLNLRSCCRWCMRCRSLVVSNFCCS